MPSQEKEWKALVALEALKKKTLFLKSAEIFSYQLELFHEFLIFQLKTDAVFFFFFFFSKSTSSVKPEFWLAFLTYIQTEEISWNVKKKE